MLGRVLTEEEERQRLQADVAAPAEADSSHAVEQQHDVGVAAAAAPTQDAPYLGSSPGYGSVTSFGRYAAEGEEHHQADYEEYTDYDGSENDDASFESYNDASSGDEDSYLLHPNNNNRRRKRKGSRRDLQNQSSSYRWMKSFKKATRKLARKIRAVAVIIADVDNVWDSPENSTTTSNNSSNRSRRANGGNNTRSSMVYDVITGGTSTIRNRTAAIFWFVVLSISYASERSTFKIMVDRVGPFRLFSAEIILGLHVLFSSLAMVFWNIFWNKDKKEFGSSYGSGFGLGLPLADVGLMAILDTVYLLVGVISGAHVPPVLTVILVQAVIPLTACFTQCVHPDGYCYGYCNPNESNESTYEYSVNDASDYYPTMTPPQHLILAPTTLAAPTRTFG
ncbi:hypothetical protein QTG54_013961 [Skeletonema marinoi]|uniref:Uncharacterized protein n=1 Tax=Skeletonema marinoi TaxID=267567 RepID=A0AAD8XX97_9STRA|nr:hypothetical protein QTG54_013961 [Skeletonema marinoi]